MSFEDCALFACGWGESDGVRLGSRREPRARYIPNPDRTRGSDPDLDAPVAAPTAHRARRTLPRTTASPFSARPAVALSQGAAPNGDAPSRSHGDDASPGLGVGRPRPARSVPSSSTVVRARPSPPRSSIPIDDDAGGSEARSRRSSSHIEKTKGVSVRSNHTRRYPLHTQSALWHTPVQTNHMAVLSFIYSPQ